MAALGDSLLALYKLPTEKTNECTYHTITEFDRTRRNRRRETRQVWSRVKSLGSGGYGVVHLERESQGELRAVKRVNKSMRMEERDMVLRELVAMGSLSRDNTNFPTFYGWFDDIDSIYIAMEYFELGDLAQCMKVVGGPLPEPEAQSICFQIAEALESIHESKIAHRDVKPSNIFVARAGPEWLVKLGDFGISKKTQTDTSLHTLFYGDWTAPEVFGLLELDDDEPVQYTCAVDIWSLGCVAYWLVTLRVPFNVRKLRAYCNTKNFEGLGFKKTGISNDALEFLRQCLELDPNIRPTPKDALELAWLRCWPLRCKMCLKEILAGNTCVDHLEGHEKDTRLIDATIRNEVIVDENEEDEVIRHLQKLDALPYPMDPKYMDIIRVLLKSQEPLSKDRLNELKTLLLERMPARPMEHQSSEDESAKITHDAQEDDDAANCEELHESASSSFNSVLITSQGKADNKLHEHEATEKEIVPAKNTTVEKPQLRLNTSIVTQSDALEMSPNLSNGLAEYLWEGFHGHICTSADGASGTSTGTKLFELNDSSPFEETCRSDPSTPASSPSIDQALDHESQVQEDQTKRGIRSPWPTWTKIGTICVRAVTSSPYMRTDGLGHVHVNRGDFVDLVRDTVGDIVIGRKEGAEIEVQRWTVEIPHMRDWTGVGVIGSFHGLMVTERCVVIKLADGRLISAALGLLSPADVRYVCSWRRVASQQLVNYGAIDINSQDALQNDGIYYLQTSRPPSGMYRFVNYRGGFVQFESTATSRMHVIPIEWVPWETMKKIALDFNNTPEAELHTFLFPATFNRKQLESATFGCSQELISTAELELIMSKCRPRARSPHASRTTCGNELSLDGFSLTAAFLGDFEIPLWQVTTKILDFISSALVNLVDDLRKWQQLHGVKRCDKQASLRIWPESTEGRTEKRDLVDVDGDQLVVLRDYMVEQLPVSQQSHEVLQTIKFEQQRKHPLLSSPFRKWDLSRVDAQQESRILANMRDQSRTGFFKRR